MTQDEHIEFLKRALLIAADELLYAASVVRHEVELERLLSAADDAREAANRSKKDVR